jgi:tetratricopeptide (TPR) repeat protein
MSGFLGRAGTGVRFALGLLLLASSAGAQSSAKQKAAAEALFQEGKALFDQGRYEQACGKFAASQELDAGFGTLMNLGECYERRGMTASAWATFKEAAGLARSAAQTDREAAARERAHRLEGALSKLVVRATDAASAIEGLEVRLNGTPLPRATWGSAVPVDPGTQHVRISAPGYEPRETELAVPKGPGETPLEIPPLVRSAQPAASNTPLLGADPPKSSLPDASPSRSDDGGTQRTIGYVLAGAGAVGLVVGTVFGLSAIAKNGDSDDECRTERLCSEEGLDLRDEARSAAAASTIAFVAGGAFAAGGLALVLTATGTSEAPTARRRAPERAAVRVSSYVGQRGVRLVMEGSF